MISKEDNRLQRYREEMGINLNEFEESDGINSSIESIFVVQDGENPIKEKIHLEDFRKDMLIASFKTQKNKIYPQKLAPITASRKSKSNAKKKLEINKFEVYWENLSYIVEKRSVFCKSPTTKVILKSLSGSFKSSELTAIMGPSGAGKSTLLSCVCGKRTNGVSGDIKIIGCERIKVAIISQDDYLTDKLTVKEALVFASKVKNADKNVDHEQVVTNVVNALNLESCVNTRTVRCSGGQRRKLSVALELVSKPNILILDEPTSGLDSSACYQIVKNLRELTQQKERMAIVATIHQPSARVFNLFDSIYIISCNGQCIYHGSPGDLIQQLSRVDLICPTFHNPADYIAEVASGEHGNEAITKLANYRTQLRATHLTDLTQSSLTLSEMSHNYKFPALLHTFLLVKRGLKLIPREPHLSWLRVIGHVMPALFLALVFGDEIGKVSGCPPRMVDLYRSKASDLFKNFEYETKKITENLGSIFYCIIFLFYAGLTPMVMVIPNEINIFVKQYTNGWYSPFTYFISKFISDLPILAIVTTLFVSIWYIICNQIPELWRFGLTLILGIMTEMVGQSQGIICSAIFSKDLVKAAFIGNMSGLPFLMFSGFFVRSKRVPKYLLPITYLSHVKYGFESIVTTIYGFNRCYYHKLNQTLPQPPWLRFLKLMNFQKVDEEEDYSYDDDKEAQTEEEAMKDILAMLSGSNVNTEDYNEYQSVVMSQFGFTDDMLYYNIAILLGYVLILQITAYYILLWKVKNTNQ